ncbi:hypothetical protein HYW43_05165 [Candidatus Daviesbacteria bacterium]|nr:hypothetical protein [Candidatus Daviesbacteria bacterium]
MEKAVLKTLIYANLFDYPLTIFEIHKWLIGKKANLRQVEKALKKLNHESRIMNYGKYHFLKGKKGLANKRRQRERQSYKYLQKAKLIAQTLKVVPTIKLIGISGGLAMRNASKTDDIDLFVVTSKNNLWISRLLILGLLSLTGQRRKATDSKRQAAGKLCLNTILEEDFLEQKSKDIYLAHEVLQMKVLWQRNGVYQRYLEENSWAFNFLPNWVSEFRVKSSELRVKKKNNSAFITLRSALCAAERLAKWWQLKIMKKPKGMERIGEGALYFHPQDYRRSILAAYMKKIKAISSST